MTVTTYTQDQWPGPPRELLPLIPNGHSERATAYVAAASDAATPAQLGIVWQDVSQRYAKALAERKETNKDSCS